MNRQRHLHYATKDRRDYVWRRQSEQMMYEKLFSFPSNQYYFITDFCHGTWSLQILWVQDWQIDYSDLFKWIFYHSSESICQISRIYFYLIDIKLLSETSWNKILSHEWNIYITKHSIYSKRPCISFVHNLAGNKPKLMSCTKS